MNLTLKQQILGICFLWSFMLVVTGGLVFVSQDSQHRSQENLEHSKLTVQNYNVVLRMMLNLENGVRGYLLTGDESQLDAFKQGEGVIVQRIQDFKAQVTNSRPAFTRRWRMNSASRSMLGNATSLAASNTQTSSSTQATATAMSEIQTMTEKTNTASKTALDTTVDCQQLAVKGQEAVTSVRSSIHLLTDSAEQVQTIVKETTSSMDSVVGEVKNKITAGTSMSTRGHELISELLQGVTSVHGIMNGICQACTEQDTGITQVNQAIQQIEESVQNQVSLANRYASTVEQLREQSEKIEKQIAALRGLFGEEKRSATAQHSSGDDVDGITWTTDDAPVSAA